MADVGCRMSLPETYEAAVRTLFGESATSERVLGPCRVTTVHEEPKDDEEDDLSDETPTHSEAGPVFVAHFREHDDVASFVGDCPGEDLGYGPLSSYLGWTMTGNLGRQVGGRYLFTGELFDEDTGWAPLSLVFFDSADGVVVVGLGERLRYEGHGVHEPVADVPTTAFCNVGSPENARDVSWYLGA
ncbi:MAG: hypothetical protein AAGE52_22860 [Myxococcota bacterium]